MYKKLKGYFFFTICILLSVWTGYNGIWYLQVKRNYEEILLKKLENQYYASVAQHVDQLHKNSLKQQQIKTAQYTPVKRTLYNSKRSLERKKRFRFSSRRFTPRPLGYGSPASIFSWPIERSSFWLSSRFGPRRKHDGSWGYHYGIDMAAPRGTPVLACAPGKVLEANLSTRGYGRTVVIRHETEHGFYETRYAHLDKIFVHVGQRVSTGYRIGAVGDTGFVRGENGGRNAYHLHFEVKKSGKHIDPLYVLI